MLPPNEALTPTQTGSDSSMAIAGDQLVSVRRLPGLGLQQVILAADGKAREPAKKIRQLLPSTERLR